MSASASSAAQGAGASAAAAPPAAAPAPRGIAASGRGWKGVQKQRATAATRQTAGHAAPGKGVRSGAFKASLSVKASKMAARAIMARLADARAAEAAAAKAKRDAKRARAAAGSTSGANLQHVDAAKLKRMTKKQLRSVKRTTVDKDGNVALVSAYGR